MLMRVAVAKFRVFDCWAEVYKGVIFCEGTVTQILNKCCTVFKASEIIMKPFLFIEPPTEMSPGLSLHKHISEVPKMKA